MKSVLLLVGFISIFSSATVSAYGGFFCDPDEDSIGTCASDIFSRSGLDFRHNWVWEDGASNQFSINIVGSDQVALAYLPPPITTTHPPQPSPPISLGSFPGTLTPGSGGSFDGGRMHLYFFINQDKYSVMLRRWKPRWDTESEVCVQSPGVYRCHKIID